MIEIALSLGIIAFALVAIIGILPYSMGVQRENREGTIINQEASILENAIRNGAQGMDDLTNYVVAITNTQTVFPAIGKPTTTVFGYTQTSSTSGPSPQSQQPMSPPFLLNNGFRIVGLLSTPKYWPIFVQTKQGQQFLGSYSNHIVATVRSMSGSAGDKAPQLNASVLDMAFAYRVICEVIPYGAHFWAPDSPYESSAWDLSWTNYLDPYLRGDHGTQVRGDRRPIHELQDGHQPASRPQ